MTNNADPDRYNYSGYGIDFDVRGSFSLADCSRFGKSVIKFGSDMSSLVHIEYKKKDIFILGKCPTDGLDDATLIAEKKYSINFT